MEQIAVDPNTKITIETTVEKLNVILTGLGKLPLESSVAVWIDIKNQAEAQLAPKPSLEVVK